MIFCKIKPYNTELGRKIHKKNDLKSLEEINKPHSKIIPVFVSENNKLRRKEKKRINKSH